MGFPSIPFFVWCIYASFRLLLSSTAPCAFLSTLPPSRGSFPRASCLFPTGFWHLAEVLTHPPLYLYSTSSFNVFTLLSYVPFFTYIRMNRLPTLLVLVSLLSVSFVLVPPLRAIPFQGVPLGSGHFPSSAIKAPSSPRASG